MMKLLVPVDGSPVANRAVELAIKQARRAGDVKILLLNVQQGLEHWHKQGLLSDESRQELRQHGEAQAAAARAMLDKSGVLYDFSIVFGHPADVIARVAGEHHCEGIVMGTRGLGDVENLMLGSTAYKVIQIAEVPVTLVK